MKTLRHILFLLAAIAGCACFSSCDENIADQDYIIYDFAGVGIDIELVDADGVNLLSPDTEGNWIGEDMSAKFDDKVYPVSWEHILFDTEKQSRMNVPTFYGLACLPKTKWNGTYWETLRNDNYLIFGDFSGHQNQHIDIVFGIEKLNTVWKIGLDYTLTWNNDKPQTTTTVKLNGKQVENGIVTIVLPRNTK